MSTASAKIPRVFWPLAFSWYDWPDHASVYPSGSTSAATSSIAASASPELKPRAGSPDSRADGNKLKRSMKSGPVTWLTVASAVSGIIAPSAERTETSRRSSGCARNFASDCICTRYTRPSRLKSLT